MIKNYQKKPVIIQAIQYLSNKNFDEVEEFIGENYQVIPDGRLIIKTLEGDMQAKEGDYIIKGVNGEFYPCKPDIFEKTYLEVFEVKDSKSEAEAERMKNILDKKYSQMAVRY